MKNTIRAKDIESSPIIGDHIQAHSLNVESISLIKSEDLSTSVGPPKADITSEELDIILKELRKFIEINDTQKDVIVRLNLDNEILENKVSELEKNQYNYSASGWVDRIYNNGYSYSGQNWIVTTTSTLPPSANSVITFENWS